MPITQSRMLDLLDAAQDFQSALDRLISMVATRSAELAEGQITAEEAMQQLTINAKPFLLLTEPVASQLTIMNEAKHFRQNAKRNERKARKLRENRQAERAGLPRPSRTTSAPRSTVPILQPITQTVRTVIDPDPKPGEELDFALPQPPPGMENIRVPEPLTPEEQAQYDLEQEQRRVSAELRARTPEFKY